LPDIFRRLFARERENVAQEGFDALVHRAFPAVPAVSLADSPSVVEKLHGGGGGKRRTIVTAFVIAQDASSGFGRAVDEAEHIEHALAAFNLCHDRCHRSYEIASRSMEGGVAAMLANLLEHADHALTQFTRGAVTADARRQFEYFGRHHTTPH
jgi:hypothetical protein